MKKVYYHGFQSNLGIFTYVCKHCGKHIEEDHLYCPYCGVNFETGKDAFRAGYEAAKKDIVNIISGGKVK